MRRCGAGEEWEALRGLLEHVDGSLWLAEYLLRVRDRKGRLRPLIANAAQRRFEERRGTENIVLKARQMGMSTWVAGRFLLRTLLVPGTQTLLVAHTRESAEMLLSTVARMWENLPTDLRDSVWRRGRANRGEMTFPLLDSELRVASAADRNAGRGMSVQNLHCSEVSRWPGDAAETLAGLRAALAPGGELVLESTPNGTYGCFYEQWRGADENGLVRHFAPWWMEPAYVGAPVAEPTAEEAALMLREGLTAEQVGFRRELTRRFGAMRVQEYPEDAATCFRVSGACFFDAGAVERRLALLREPLDVRRGGALLVWLPPVPGRTYVVAADAAGGGSAGDYAAVQVIDVATGMQCAEWWERAAPDGLARVAAELAREYNGALLVVERNNHGAAVIAYLRDEVGVRLYAGRDGMAGWLTDVASRPRMLRELAELIAGHAELFASERLLNECRSFVTDVRGRAAAAVGAHDDLVMAMAIGQAVRSSESAGQRVS